MRIRSIGQVDDGLIEVLKNKLKKKADSVRDIQEEQLEESREKLDQEPPESNLEQALDQDPSSRTDTEKDSDDSEQGLTERRLRDKDAPGKNTALQGTTQARLEKASTDSYPHRNPEAWERTGDKRPINNLPSEMGEASDEARLKRWRKAEDKAKKQEPERVVDKDVGEQRPDRKYLKSFNSRRRKNARKYAKYVDYIVYKAGSGNVWNSRMAKVKKIDAELESIMAKQNLGQADRSKITALKERKWELLRMAQAPQQSIGDWPSPAYIANELQVSEEAANQVIQMAQQAEGSGADQAEAVLQQADKLLGGFGVESLRDPESWDNYYGDTEAIYVNMGSLDKPTLIYDVSTESFSFLPYSEWIEKHEAEKEAMVDEEWEDPEEDEDEAWAL